ncbi:MAG: hypothetical protein AB1631_28540 [Acidobacteriota bacterium]
MARRITLSMLFLFMLGITSNAQQWDKYMPEKGRKSIVNKARRVSGVGAAMAGHIALAIWITDPVARAFVSDAIDKERLTPDEAETRYRQLRPEGSIAFLIDARRQTANKPFGNTKASTLDDPLVAAETFLQRADDRNTFSKAEVADHKFEINLGSFFRPGDLQSVYRVVFPRVDRQGKPIIRDLSDKIEIQFNLAGKKIVLDYKVKEVVSRLEDL